MVRLTFTTTLPPLPLLICYVYCCVTFCFCLFVCLFVCLFFVQQSTTNTRRPIPSRQNVNVKRHPSIHPFIHSFIHSFIIHYTYYTHHNQNTNQNSGPLGPILEKVFQSNNYKINFFSLDVEGAEKLVLDTIDFTTKVHIDILMIEVVNEFCKKNEECLVRDQVREKMVNELGYIKYENIVPASDIYVHPNSKYQMKK
jgi:heme/copper-type cytochrome/quinol oxidase subunit 2